MSQKKYAHFVAIAREKPRRITSTGHKIDYKYSNLLAFFWNWLAFLTQMN